MRRGMVVVKEAAELLRDMSMTFFVNRGSYAEGQYVTVAVDPHWENKESMRVIVTCYAHGHRFVDWTGIEVVAKATDGKEFCTSINQRGQCVLKGLHPTDYKISLMIPDEEDEEKE